MSATAYRAPGFAGSGTASRAMRGETSLRQDAYTGYTTRDLLTVIFVHQRVLAFAFLVPLLLGLLAALASHTVYVAQARLLVLLGNEYIFQPTGNQDGQGISLDRDQIVQGELEILQSTTLARETLNAVGLRTAYPKADPGKTNGLELAADQLDHDLTVTSVPDTNVIELSLRSYSPTVGARVLTTLIDLYLQRRQEVFSRGAGDGVDSQQQTFADRLQTAEQALANFSEQHGITDLDAQITLLLNRKSINASELAANTQQIALVGAQVAAMRTELARTPQTVQLYNDTARAPNAVTLGDALANLQARRTDLAAKYRDDFPLVQDADRQIAQLRAAMGHAGATGDGGRAGINATWQDLVGQLGNSETELRGLTAQSRTLADTGTGIQNRLDELTELGRQYRSLKTLRDTSDDAYRTFLHDTEQTEVSGALERSRAANIRIVQPAEPPAHGSSLRMLIAVAGFMLGGVAAIAVLVLLVALQQNFVTQRDAERALDLPVLIAITERAGRRA